jgi:hypothetical protein
MPKLVESFADIQITEKASEVNHVGSQDATQSKSTFKYKSSHPEDLIIGNKDSPRKIISSFRQEHSMLELISMIEPASVDEALSGDGLLVAIQEELNQFQRNYVWDLVAKLPQKNIIRTKWVFKNKLNELGDVVRNKENLCSMLQSTRGY